MPFTYVDAESEYTRNSYLKKENVEYLQEWLQKQPHLPAVNDAELIFFLKSCRYSIEKTKTTIDNFYTLRASTDTFVPANMERLKSVMDNAVQALFPKLTPEGFQILYVRPAENANKYDFLDEMCYMDSLCRVYLLQRPTPEGLVSILDLSTLSFAHLTKIPLGPLRKYMMYLQEALPIRLIGIHFVNAGSIVDRIFAMIKPFVKAELLDIMHVHRCSLETLHQFVPVDCLPQELGGCLGSIAKYCEQHQRMLIENEEFLERDQKQFADESKREDKSKSINNMFGAEGSFKKLEID